MAQLHTGSRRSINTIVCSEVEAWHTAINNCLSASLKITLLKAAAYMVFQECAELQRTWHILALPVVSRSKPTLSVQLGVPY
jgi:hypothetical protein